MKNYEKLVVGLISAWFVFALFASALGLFSNNANGFGLAVAVASGTPIVLFFLWFAASSRFRQFALSLNPRILTFLQGWRVLGVVFVILQAYHILPAIFALPAGYGDVFIGATAPFVAWKLADPSRRGSFILWQVLGISDLLIAVTLGTTARLLVAQDISMTAMTVLPLSLVPTFLVPLFLIFHVICIAQASAWKASVGAMHAQTLASDPIGGRF